MTASVNATKENGARTAALARSARITQIGPLGKPVGAVITAATVLRVLHVSGRPPSASEVARDAGLHRSTAYNILRTLQGEGFVGYDEATRIYAVSLYILELAYGALWRSGLLDIARPLMNAVSDDYGIAVYLSKVLGPSSMLLLDWVGVALRPDPHITVGRQYPSPPGASGVVIATFGAGGQDKLEAAFPQVHGHEKPSFADFLTRAEEAKRSGLAVDRGTIFRGTTLVWVPVLSPSSELLLILTATGISRELTADAVNALSRVLQSAVARRSDSLPLLWLGWWPASRRTRRGVWSRCKQSHPKRGRTVAPGLTRSSSARVSPGCTCSIASARWA